MSTPLGQIHNKVVRQELVVSALINALVPAGIIWALDVTPPQRLIGEHVLLGASQKAHGLSAIRVGRGFIQHFELDNLRTCCIYYTTRQLIAAPASECT